MMERLTKTTVGQLIIGDRFYKLGDKKKIVHQVLSIEPKKSLQATSHVVNCLQQGGNPRYLNEIKSTQPVIFLRHIDQ